MLLFFLKQKSFEVQWNMVEELTIEQTEKELFELDALITDGTNNLIPVQFEYPGTDKIVGVYIRPITTTELTNATRGGGNIFTNVLTVALYNQQKEHFSDEFLGRIPAGVAVELYKKIAEVSGIPTEDKELEKKQLDKLMGF